MDDIKTHPKGKPKIKTRSSLPKTSVRGAEALSKASALYADKLRKDAGKKVMEKTSPKEQRAEVQATESVENSAYVATDTVYRESKSAVRNIWKYGRSKTGKQTKDKADDVSETTGNEIKNGFESVKVKETGIAVKEEAAPEPLKHTASDGCPLVKTKENYIRSLNGGKTEPVKTLHRNFVLPKQNSHIVAMNREKKKVPVKTGQSLVNKAKNIVKSGNIYTARTLEKNTPKVAEKGTKKVLGQVSKNAKTLLKNTAKASKASKRAAKTAVRVVKVAARKAIKALFSALAVLGGGAVTIVALIVVIVVAAIAASPFGIFISDEAAAAGSIPISSIIAECNLELSSRLDRIEDNAAPRPDKIVTEGSQADWGLVLSVFAVKTAGADDLTAEDVVVIDERKKEKLKQVFWDMNSISSRVETRTVNDVSENVLYISIVSKTKEEMTAQYGFTDKQKEALNTLLENSDAYTAATQSLAVSDGTAQDVLRTLPDGLLQSRKDVVKAACSLVGKVNYFWGGKSAAIGWDNNWGKMTLVTAEGSRTSGSMRPFGLDCSGFVTWSFINSGFSASQIGHGTHGQIAKCTRIPWNSAQPGDLAFLSDLSHVGIIAGKDTNGNILVIHCS